MRFNGDARILRIILLRKLHELIVKLLDIVLGLLLKLLLLFGSESETGELCLMQGDDIIRESIDEPILEGFERRTALGGILTQILHIGKIVVIHCFEYGKADLLLADRHYGLRRIRRFGLLLERAGSKCKQRERSQKYSANDSFKHRIKLLGIIDTYLYMIIISALPINASDLNALRSIVNKTLKNIKKVFKYYTCSLGA